MGTNYYVLKKQNLDRENQIYNILNNINIDDLNNNITNLIKTRYKEALNLLNTSELNKYNEQLNETIEKFLNHIKYGVNDVFDINDSSRIHIGKSSAGWLFNFQIQKNEVCTWNSYEEVMNWLEQNTANDKAIYKIIDEYNRSISFKDFKELVDIKQKDPHNIKNPDNFTYCKNINGYRFSEGEFS